MQGSCSSESRPVSDYSGPVFSQKASRSAPSPTSEEGTCWAVGQAKASTMEVEPQNWLSERVWLSKTLPRVHRDRWATTTFRSALTIIKTESAVCGLTAGKSFCLFELGPNLLTYQDDPQSHQLFPHTNHGVSFRGSRKEAKIKSQDWSGCPWKPGSKPNKLDILPKKLKTIGCLSILQKPA